MITFTLARIHHSNCWEIHFQNGSDDEFINLEVNFNDKNHYSLPSGTLKLDELLRLKWMIDKEIKSLQEEKT